MPPEPRLKPRPPEPRLKPELPLADPSDLLNFAPQGGTDELRWLSQHGVGAPPAPAPAAPQGPEAFLQRLRGMFGKEGTEVAAPEAEAPAPVPPTGTRPVLDLDKMRAIVHSFRDEISRLPDTELEIERVRISRLRLQENLRQALLHSIDTELQQRQSVAGDDWAASLEE